MPRCSQRWCSDGWGRIGRRVINQLGDTTGEKMALRYGSRRALASKREGGVKATVPFA